MTFTLDTSGVVACFPTLRSSWQGAEHLSWSDLSPFAQGYVEALFAELTRDMVRPLEGRGAGWGLPAFSDLSPEALAMILGDCEAYRAERDERGPYPAAHWTAERGGDFWGSRQCGTWINFPPYTVSLGDDGKVRLAVAA